MNNPTPAARPHRSQHEQVIAEAMAELDGIGEVPLAEALGRLTAACETLNAILDTSAEAVQPAFPGLAHT